MDTINTQEAAVAPDDGGLTSAEAAERLQQSGPNVVAMAHPSRVVALLRKFWGLIPWMLELAFILDLVLGRWVEAGVIALWLIFNALMGFLQQSRAQEALALLRQRLTINSRVSRDGRWQVLPAAQLVPGDLVHLRAGDIVPADVRLTAGQVQVDQSQLTGESLPVDYPPGNTAYAGSMVNRGEATGVVAATGGRTYFGKTAELVRTAEAPRRLELLILNIAKYLAALDILLAVAVLASGVIRGTPVPDLLTFVLLLMVASVPVALPAMFTMTAALGARQLAQGGVLATRLSAIEDAASMDVLCLDKTGTITQNRLSVEKLEASAPATPDDLLRLASLASDEATQDPIDLAILRAARERGITLTTAQRSDFVPFDPATKRSEVSVSQDGQMVRIVKGAPAAVAELAKVPWPEIAGDVGRLSADGSRVLAVATGADASLHLAGLIALGDPPSPDSQALIADLRKQGVRVLLVTGDGEATARAVATRVGITGEVAPAGTLREHLDPEMASRFEVFAGVLPQDKFYLVQALQRAGHVVGMTGDGVNDAPALRQADVGIAVANSTDVAKAAASLVLTRPGLGEIVTSIESSRRIYQRMKTFVLAMVTRKMGIPPFLALGVLLLGVFVLNPLLMVLFMFTGDVANVPLSMDRVNPSPVPDRWIVRPLMITGLGLAALLLLLSGAVYWAGGHLFGLGLAATQTLVFVWLVFAGGQAALYTARARGFFWNRPYPVGWLVLTSLLDVFVATLLATQGWLMAPISLPLVGGMFLLAVVFLVAADLLKTIVTHLAVQP